MNSSPSEPFNQSAVIPYRTRNRRLEVLLITSRRYRRWIVPKGIVEPNLSPADSAAKEAWEEAGVRGRVLREALGTYLYEKWGGTCRVEVFPMEVTEVESRWPESHRVRLWLSPSEAAARVDEPELAGMIRALPETVGKATAGAASQQPSDPAVTTLARLFAQEPVWQSAMRRVAEGANSAVYFSHLPGRSWHLIKRAGTVLLLPGPAPKPDFAFCFTPASVASLAAVSGGADDVAVSLFDLILSDDDTQGVGFRILAPFGTLVRHGHLRLVIESGPKTILYGMRHGILTVGQLRRFAERLRSAATGDWPCGDDMPNDGESTFVSQ